MNTKHLLFYIFLCMSFAAAGKSKHKKATVVLESGDTVSGNVVDKNWSRNPSSFKITSDSGEMKEYKPSQIKSIQIDSADYFISAYTPIDMNYIISLDSDNGIVGKVETDTIFLRVLLEAPVGLYIFNDRNGKDHFLIRKNNEPFEELIDKKYKMYHEGRYIMRNVSTYKQRLEKYMQDCKTCVEDLTKTDYSEKKLLKLLLKYNQSLYNNSITYVGKVTPPKLQFAVIAGLDITDFRIEGDSYSNHLELGDYSKSYKPTIGLRINIPFARLLDRQSVIMDFSWREYETDASYTYKYYEYGIHFNMRYIRFSPAYCYKFTNTNLRPYLTAGISFGYMVSCENTMHLVDNNPYYPSESESEAYIDPHKFDLGLNAAAGLQYKRFNLEVRLDTFSGFTTTASLDAKVNSTCILLGYRFY